MPKRKVVSLPAVQALLAELRAFADEFDHDDPESSQVALDTHISALLETQKLRVRRRRRQWRLDDVCKAILDGHTADDLMEQAQSMQDLINSYLDEPSKEDMEEAENILGGLIERIEAYLDGARK